MAGAVNNTGSYNPRISNQLNLNRSALNLNRGRTTYERHQENLPDQKTRDDTQRSPSNNPKIKTRKEISKSPTFSKMFVQDDGEEKTVKKDML